MGRIVEPPAPPASEIEAHSGVYEDGRFGFAFGQFGKEIKELVILRNPEPEGEPYYFPPTEWNVRYQQLIINQFEMRPVAGNPDILGSMNLNILTYDLTAAVLINALQLEDFSYLLLENEEMILMEEGNV